MTKSPTKPARIWIHLAVIVGLFVAALYVAWRLWSSVSHAAAVFPLALFTGIMAFYSAGLWLAKR